MAHRRGSICGTIITGPGQWDSTSVTAERPSVMPVTHHSQVHSTWNFADSTRRLRSNLIDFPTIQWCFAERGRKDSPEQRGSSLGRP